jgi:hypothetical protein
MSSPPTQAVPSAPGAQPEIPSNPDLIATIPLALATEPPAEASSNFQIAATLPQLLAESLPPTEAETQTRADPDAPVPPELLAAETLLAERAASALLKFIPKVAADAPRALSSLLPSTSRNTRVTDSTHEEEHPLPPIPPVEPSPRLSDNRNGRYSQPPPQPLDLPGVVRRPSAVHFDGLEPEREWSPPIESHEVRPL